MLESIMASLIANIIWDEIKIEKLDKFLNSKVYRSYPHILDPRETDGALGWNSRLLPKIKGSETKPPETFSIFVILPSLKSATIILPSEFVKYKFLSPITKPIG